MMKFGLKESTITELIKVFASFPRIKEVILYGSRAKGNFRIGSDIDLVIKGKGLDINMLNRISSKLDDLMLPYTIDLSLYDHVQDAELLDHIERVGIVFYKKKETKTKRVQ
jgi:uncharacterized protein